MHKRRKFPETMNHAAYQLHVGDDNETPTDPKMSKNFSTGDRQANPETLRNRKDVIQQLLHTCISPQPTNPNATSVKLRKNDNPVRMRTSMVLDYKAQSWQDAIRLRGETTVEKYNNDHALHTTYYNNQAK